MAFAVTLVLPRPTAVLAHQGDEAPAAQQEGGPASCDSPPEGAEATPEDCNRFVGLWLPRVSDEAWLKAWTAQSDVPPEIAAEGFHGLNDVTKGWLVSALTEQGAANKAPTPSFEEVQKTTGVLALLIFGKADLNQLRQEFAANPNAGQSAAAGPSELQPVRDALANATTAAQSLHPTPASPAPPVVSSVTGVANGIVSPALDALIAPDPSPSVAALPASPPPSMSTAALDANALIALIIGILTTPPISDLLALITTLLGAVSNIQQRLFAIPGLNLLGGLTYRICAQSATQPLACTVNLPVGVPIPTDVNGDSVPDVYGHLAPVVGAPQVKLVSVFPLVVQVVATPDIGFSFEVRRLFPNSGPLPAHVFAVYDPPRTSKRVEYGYDARLSTLATSAKSTVTLRNIMSAIKGDVEALATVTHQAPGNNEALTFAMKELVSQPNGLPLERDPTVGAVRFTPVPTNITANLHLQHYGGKNQDTIGLGLNLQSLVTALLTQDVNTVSPASHREFSALIDKLPNYVAVDVLNQNPKQTITYGANAVINHINVNQKSIDNTSQPGTYTQNTVDILQLPQNVKLTLTGAEDILYEASSVIPQVQFLTQQVLNSVTQKEIVATANGIPKNIHLSNVTAADSSTVTYDADSSLAKLGLGMFDLPNDKTVISALAQGFPTHMQLVQTKSTGATTYTADGPIQTIEATLTRNDGTTIPLPGIDHATVKKVGTAIGLDFKLSGLAGATIDPSEKASYGLKLSPGGQPFQAIAELDDPNRRADVLISNLPKDMLVTLDPGNGKATWTADQVINSVDARYEEIDVGRLAEVGLDLIPKSIVATWDTGGDEPKITYEADSRLGGLSAFYQEEPGGTTFSGLVSDLPLFMSVEGVDPIIFDAKSSAAAASHSDAIGQILLRYGSDGNLPATGNPVDHLYLSDTTSTNAELLYSGLAYLKADTANDELHIQVNNSAPRRFEADVITPNMTVDAFIEKIPSEVKVDMVDEQVKYAANAPITQIGATVDRLNGDLINVLIDSVPEWITVDFDSVASTINWTAQAVTGGISATAQFGPTTTGTSRTYNAGLAILGIPAIWNASFASGHILFDGVSSAIGSITATFTNHGTVNTFPGEDGLSAVFNEGTGDLDAYLRISLLDRAEFQKIAPTGTGAGGFDANLNMGNGGTFKLNADVLTADGTLLDVFGSILNFPTQMHLNAVDGVTTYNGVGNPTFDIDAAFGKVAAINATPPAPQQHGISVRDGISGGDKAIKASLFITGLPNILNFNTVTGIYTVTGFNPTTDTLVLDVELDNFVSPAATLLATQDIGAGPVNFTFGPFTSGQTGDGSETINASYSASRGMGAFTADASFGTNAAHVFISNVPISFNLATLFGENTKTINISVGQVVQKVEANYKNTGDAGFFAGATIEDIPAATNIPSIALTLGEQGPANGVQTPTFTYTASDDGVDLSAFLDELALGPVSEAGFILDIDDLGESVSAGLSGTTLTLGSSPQPTVKFQLDAHAHLNFDVDLGFTLGPLHHVGNLNIAIDVKRLTIGFTDMSDLTIRLGIVSAISGNYGTFKFGQDTATTITVNSDLDFEADTIFGTADVGIVEFNIVVPLGNVVPTFRVADNHLEDWWTADLIPLVCVHAHGDIPIPHPHVPDAVVKLKPHPHGNVSASPPFTLVGADANGGAWLLTPNPFNVVPDRVLDIVAAIKAPSPFDGDASFTVECQ